MNNGMCPLLCIYIAGYEILLSAGTMMEPVPQAAISNTELRAHARLGSDIEKWTIPRGGIVQRLKHGAPVI